MLVGGSSANQEIESACNVEERGKGCPPGSIPRPSQAEQSRAGFYALRWQREWAPLHCEKKTFTSQPTREDPLVVEQTQDCDQGSRPLGPSGIAGCKGENPCHPRGARRCVACRQRAKSSLGLCEHPRQVWLAARIIRSHSRYRSLAKLQPVNGCTQRVHEPIMVGILLSKRVDLPMVLELILILRFAPSCEVQSLRHLRAFVTQ